MVKVYYCSEVYTLEKYEESETESVIYFWYTDDQLIIRGQHRSVDIILHNTNDEGRKILFLGLAIGSLFLNEHGYALLKNSSYVGSKWRQSK
jgi:hypothetical protein